MKTLKILCAGVSALALLALAACNNDEPNEEPEITYDDAYWAELASISSSDANFSSTSDGGTIYFKTEGGSVSVTVDCGCDWTVEDNASDLFPTTITNSSTLTVSAGQNTVEEELTGTITLLTASARISFATITITQNAYGAPEISAETNEWNFAAKGDLTTEIAVEASADWTAESADEWLTVIKNDDSITLTAAENEDTAERSTRVVLTCTDGIKTASEFIAVTQDAAAYITLSDESVRLAPSEGSEAVTVESNYDWDYSYDADNGWYEITRDGDALTVSVTENKGTDEREGTVILTAGDGAENTCEAQLTVVQTGNTAMILTYTISSASTSVQLPLYGTVDCTVDWGDGSEIESVTSTLPAHTYAAAGDYDITINGTVTALYSKTISKADSPLPVTAVKQWGKTGLTDMQYAFYYCKNLASLPEDTGDAFADVTSFLDAFYYCQALTSLPAGIFAGCAKCTTFSHLFYYCTKIAALPDNLFNCPVATAMDYVFYRCTALTTIPGDLFANCPEVTTFDYAFYYCTGLTEIPATLFSQNVKALTFTDTFYHVGVPTSLPENLFASCTEATSFTTTFAYMTGLTTVPENLFANNTKVTDFTSAFYQCTGLKEIPSGLFAKNTAATVFDKAFYTCSGLTAIPGNLFDNNTNALSFDSTFYSCTGLTSIPESLFAKCVNATDFDMVFERCSAITEIPANLFVYNTKAETFLGTFYMCSAVTTIPESLFYTCTEAKSFNSTFYQCKGLTEIPVNLFSKNTKAETFNFTFGYCSNLVTVPEDLFINNTAVTDFSYLFGNCTTLPSVPEKLFANNPEVTNFEGTLNNCKALTSIPENLFAKCPKVTSFKYTFYYCSGLTGLPAGLFANNPEVTTAYQTFGWCKGLESVPAGIFSNNLKIDNFYQTFYACSALTGESPYDEITVDGETVKVHLYERADYASAIGYATPTTTGGCFFNCSGLSDYSDIPSGWK